MRLSGVEQIVECRSTDAAHHLAPLPRRCGIDRVALTDYAAEQFEVAASRALVAAAEAAGESEVARLCRENLREDEEMARWLDQQTPAIVQHTLRKETAGTRRTNTGDTPMAAEPRDTDANRPGERNKEPSRTPPPPKEDSEERGRASDFDPTSDGSEKGEVT